jgi:mannosylglycerate hydrolase
MRTIHVISHTHWDREWYRTFQQFRLRLVHLVDELLELLERDPAYMHFMLDGQTIVLDDYLHMRPEKEAILREHIQTGRLLIGPWHILPDMFLVGPEAHIRNLLQGDRTARLFGPKMPIGYIPDPFGHPGQVPQILRGFGIDTACLWRGVDETASEFWWQSPDGSRVLMLYMRDGYGNGAELPADNLEKFAAQLAERGDSLAPDARTSQMLVMYGTDHMEPPRNTSEAIAYADEMLPETHVLHSTLPAYLAAVRAEIEKGSLQFPTVTGELRACRRMHLLPGVLSTRMWIKQRNQACENLLTRWVEPFSTWQELVTGNGIPAGNLTRKAGLIRQAWRLLMENHPHDSICGCSIDQVHDEMKPRFDQVEQIGTELTQQSLAAIAEQVDTTGAPADSAILVFNPHSAARTETVGAEIRLPPEADDFEILDEHGGLVPYEKNRLGAEEFVNGIFDRKGMLASFNMVNEGRVMGMGVRTFNVRREGSQVALDVVLAEGEPDKAVWERGAQETLALVKDETVTTFQVRARTMAQVKTFFRAADVPGLGWKTYYVHGKKTASQPTRLPGWTRILVPVAAHLASSPRSLALLERLQKKPASKPPYVIENDTFRVEAEKNGTLTVLDKRSRQTFRGLNRFEDGGDRGDEYNYCPPEHDLKRSPRLVRVEVEKSPLRQSLLLRLELTAPACLAADRKSRSRQTTKMEILSRVTLTAGVDRLDIQTRVDNRARDHRLRAHFPSGIKADRAYHDGHFEVVERRIGLPVFDETWVEQPRPEVPQRAFSAVTDGRSGLMVANRGLPEVEAVNNEAGETEIALTLLRSVGWLSRDDLSTRRGHAGPYLATPGAQLAGGWEFEYSILPLTGGWETACQLAYGYQTPFLACGTGVHSGTLPAAGSFLTVEPAEFVISAVKETEDGRGWLVRGYNLSRREIEVSLKSKWIGARVERVNLAEERLEELPAIDGRVTFRVQPAGIAGIVCLA